MTNFIPGKVVKTFQTKSGKEAVIRYPKWEDLDELTEFINELSAEDVHIAYSGESISKDEEIEFLTSIIKGIEKQKKVYVVCVIDNKIVGGAEVSQVEAHRLRGKHLGTFGLIVRADYRSQGIGYQLLMTVIDETKQRLNEIRTIRLDVYGSNEKAFNLYTKCGFREYGRLPKGIEYKGEYIDLIEMYLEV